jgi:hypothetical protein
MDRPWKDWVTLKHTEADVLPQVGTRSFVSAPVLFIAEGKLYAGEYHKNGWFYIRWPNSILRDMVRGDVNAKNHESIPHAWCEKWRYMND